MATHAAVGSLRAGSWSQHPRVSLQHDLKRVQRHAELEVPKAQRLRSSRSFAINMAERKSSGDDHMSSCWEKYMRAQDSMKSELPSSCWVVTQIVTILERYYR